MGEGGLPDRLGFALEDPVEQDVPSLRDLDEVVVGYAQQVDDRGAVHG